MKNQHGFTIIELIIVIAIIAILAAIVLINVTQYINKGKDAAAKADLNTLLVNGIAFYNSSGNYNGWLGDSGYTSVRDALVNAGYIISPSCDPNSDCSTTTNPNTAWCASIPLKQYSPTQTYCVDSSQAKKQGTGETCDSGACP